MNYTWSDKWRVRGANVYASETETPPGGKVASAAEKCKALQHLWGKEINKWMCASMQGEFGPFVLLGEKNELQWLS